jgi:hypothetical protein
VHLRLNAWLSAIILRFWGIFWIDVISNSTVKQGFEEIAQNLNSNQMLKSSTVGSLDAKICGYWFSTTSMKVLEDCNSSQTAFSRGKRFVQCNRNVQFQHITFEILSNFEVITLKYSVYISPVRISSSKFIPILAIIAFVNAPILAHYDPSLETWVETDAFDFVVLGVLSQMHDGILKSVDYSR